MGRPKVSELLHSRFRNSTAYRMKLVFKALLTGSLVASLGLISGFVPIGRALEERYGLDILFSLRGTRTPPRDVVIVAMDKISADHLSVSEDFSKWPRSLHARLVEFLKQRGASVIVFDVIFEEAHSQQEDASFVKAVSWAGNVVLSCFLKTESVPAGDTTEKNATPEGKTKLTKLVLPLSPLCKIAAGVAPFLLPKVPPKVSQYWTFKPEAGDIPTLPAVALYVFALDALDEFEKLTEKTGYLLDDFFLKKPDDTVRYERVVARIRAICENNRHLIEKFIDELESRRGQSLSETAYNKLKALTRMYQAPSMSYLNFYGPPQTIATIPYYRIFSIPFSNREKSTGFNFKDKAVFIGHSTRHPDHQKEGIFTVFSDSSGLDLSGVEIAATSFANLIDNSAVRPVPPGHLALIFISRNGSAS